MLTAPQVEPDPLANPSVNADMYAGLSLAADHCRTNADRCEDAGDREYWEARAARYAELAEFALNMPGSELETALVQFKARREASC